MQPAASTNTEDRTGGNGSNQAHRIDRAILLRQSWNPRASCWSWTNHKMRGWKNWLKGVVDGRRENQSLLVTGSVRMNTFRQSGDSLAGRYFALRLHPISVREWCEQQGASELLNAMHYHCHPEYA